MRSVFLLGSAVVLAACSTSSTPVGGDCASRASAELNALKGAITTAQTNLANGYSIERRFVEGSTTVEEVHVPLNAAKEKQKLAGLQARLGPVQAQTDAALARCGS